MNALVFGINGQDGFYLSQLLNKKEIKVIGISRSDGNWIKGNVADYSFVEEVIKSYSPDYIFHFAANSTTRHDAVLENHDSITTGTLNILESCYKYSKHSKIFLSGSAVQFENKGIPINESTPFAPLSPYAVSRIAAVYSGRYYRSLGLKVYVGYFFNHDSPLRSDRHINKKIISTVKRISEGSKEILEIGDITAKKEFNFAGDFMEAIWMLVNQDFFFEAVIGSGKAYAIQDWIKICFDMVNLDWSNYIRKKEGFVTEYEILVSDPRLIKSIDWEPAMGINELAGLMFTNN